MKVFSDSFKSKLAATSTTLCTVWQITRKDGRVFAFTDHDRDLAVSGQIYLAAGGYSASAIKSDSAMSTDNLDVEGYLDSDLITEADLSNGLWDYAAVKIGCVDWSAPALGVDWQRTGWLGEVTITGQAYKAELRGIMQALQQTIGRTYTPLCDAQLGDARCKVGLAAHTVTGTVGSVPDRMMINDSARSEAAGWFAYGMLTFTSGLNSGASREVLTSAVGSITLAYPFSYEIAPGDGYSLVRGCVKTKACCKDTFANVVNFRGFAEIPGNNAIVSGT